MMVRASSIRTSVAGARISSSRHHPSSCTSTCSDSNRPSRLSPVPRPLNGMDMIELYGYKGYPLSSTTAKRAGIIYSMMLLASQDYPRTWNEFLDWFSSEESCAAYLERLRWPHGFVCPNCGSMTPPYRASRIRLMCKDCRHQGTVTAGTIFDKTRTPLRVWLAAAWYLTNQKQGVSALGLQRVLGLKSYQTAWTMLHRFR